MSKIQLKTPDGQAFEVPEGGSLGLLALGYVGVMLWREKRREIQTNQQINTQKPNEKT